MNELAIALRSRVPSYQILTMLYRPSPGAAWPAAIIAWGPGFTSTVHAHHSLQLVMSMEGSLLVCGGPHDEWRRCGAALIRPDAVHAVDAHRGTVLIAFIEAESQLGAILCERIEGDIACVGRRQVANWRDTLGSPPSNAGVKRWVDGFLLHRRSAVPGDLRVLRVLTYMRERLGTARDLSLQALAAIAGVSRSRFMHIFTAAVGVPLRPYILWLRLQRAVFELIDGASISAAAHRAGFADAAHLSRTCRRMLGATPSYIALRTRISSGVAFRSD